MNTNHRFRQLADKIFEIIQQMDKKNRSILRICKNQY